jgi:endonuclease/exonuclease/phosphatase family metal-dependent hydrolase
MTGGRHHESTTDDRAVSRLRVATYNIHRCRGMDGLTRPARIIGVLRELDADIVALQEVVGAGPTGGGQAEEIGAALGMGWVMASTRIRLGHAFGNVVLSRLPIEHHTQYDLSWRDREPRCCQRADLRVDGGVLHVFNVHLGTAVLERHYQASRLAAFVHDHRTPGRKVVLGDFNEWVKGLTTRLLNHSMKSVDLRAFLRRRRTYPGVFPVVHLDHIYYDGAIDVTNIQLPRTRLALVAADHLPLVADLTLR